MPPRPGRASREPADAAAAASALDTAPAGIERLLGRIEGWFDGVVTKLDELGERGDRRHEDISAKIDQLSERSHGWDGIRQDVADIARDHEGLETRVRALEQQVVPRGEVDLIRDQVRSMADQQTGLWLWVGRCGALIAAVGAPLGGFAGLVWWLSRALPAARP